ncbi:hypothetical protein Nepgr_008016 [Nepenthes gracilis]|uniref:Uncharacterized protein n=1 Tax=Nepenthes gracilis TaxID=150966 RepID=A0AAD3S8B0_NEPGR|nr:hypothetical protein Nepgr_008016 [Nepenthes gracilis]
MWFQQTVSLELKATGSCWSFCWMTYLGKRLWVFFYTRTSIAAVFLVAASPSVADEAGRGYFSDLWWRWNTAAHEIVDSLPMLVLKCSCWPVVLCTALVFGWVDTVVVWCMHDYRQTGFLCWSTDAFLPRSFVVAGLRAFITIPASLLKSVAAENHCITGSSCSFWID